MNKVKVHNVLERVWNAAQKNEGKTFDEWYYFIKMRETNILKELREK